jgi:hypothetical protein
LTSRTKLYPPALPPPIRLGLPQRFPHQRRGITGRTVDVRQCPAFEHVFAQLRDRRSDRVNEAAGQRVG